MEQVEKRHYNGHDIATVFHDAGSKKIVIFCHGFRGASIGPIRTFVLVARQLAERGISSLRFDQYGSGNSDGNFMESSFNDWVATAAAIVEDYKNQGYEVALLGQSMGAATIISVAASTDVVAAVAWVPDPNVGTFTVPADGVVEEGGQRVGARYWQEAHDMHVAEKLTRIIAPMYIVQCSDDEYVSPENHQAIADSAQPNHIVEMFEGYKHSAWTYDQAEGIIAKTVNFIVTSFGQ